jgi:nicotinate-nucleotide pyrophosphorylase (carboxylating)
VALQAVHPPASSWRELLQRALAEDIGAGDLTSDLTLSADLEVDAVLVARSPLLVCGLRVAAEAFVTVDPRIRFEAALEEGAGALPDDPLAMVSGPARGVLAAERTALNFVGRMSGVATSTRDFVQRVAGTGTQIVDTRKTLPGWRVLDKYAVAVGGGTNQRGGLFDAILVKDNHIAAAGGVAAAVKAARVGAPAHLWLQVEVESEAEAEAALEAGADALLLDNRSPDELRRLVARFGARTTLEASGGVDLGTVRRIAETGVHRISVGALTHSAPWADVSLEVRRAPVTPLRPAADSRDQPPGEGEVEV